MISRRILLTAGPTNAPAEVVSSLLVENQSHHSLQFRAAFLEVRRLVLSILSSTPTHVCIPMACSASGANEAIIGSVSRSLLILNAGRYSRQAIFIARALSVPYHELTFDPLVGIEAALVEAYMEQHASQVSDIFFTHLETTTGTLAPLRELAEIAKKYNVNLLVDAVSSAFGHAVDFAPVAALSLSFNKCLEGVPGVAAVLARVDWLQRLTASRGYYFDLRAQHHYIVERSKPRHTISPNVLGAALIALKRLSVETLEKRALRYRSMRDELRKHANELHLRVERLPSRVDSNLISLLHVPLDFVDRIAGLEQEGVFVNGHPEMLEKGLLAVATCGDLTMDEIAYAVRKISCCIHNA